MCWVEFVDISAGRARDAGVKPVILMPGFVVESEVVWITM